MVKFCPHRDFCFDTGHIILLVVAAIGLYCYHLSSKTIETQTLNTLTNIIKGHDEKIDNLQRHKNKASMYVRDRDYSRIINPLLPPERSNHTEEGLPINIPSRGESGSYQQVGVLVNNNSAEGKILPLYGKQTYPGSRNWLYYTSSDGYQTVKLPIANGNKDCTDDTGCHEITNGDHVEVPAYEQSFKANIYKFDKPRYIPYVN